MVKDDLEITEVEQTTFGTSNPQVLHTLLLNKLKDQIYYNLKKLVCYINFIESIEKNMGENKKKLPSRAINTNLRGTREEVFLVQIHNRSHPKDIESSNTNYS
jgi:hypothetical protein